MQPSLYNLAPPTHYTYGRARPIRYIVVHATAGVDSLRWLSGGSNPPVSCHVLVTKTGTRYRIVEDKNTAWHAGFSKYVAAGLCSSNLNASSLGIEIENLNNGLDRYPETQIDASAYQVATWLQAYPYLCIVRHTDVDSSKRDPTGLDMEAFCRRVYKHLCGLSSG